jgi:hypothetical protein
MSKTIDVATIVPVTDIETKGLQILSLIETYIPGFVGRYYGYKNIGRSDVSFPALFVEPMSVDFKMITTAKHEIWITYMLEWYILENNSSDAVTVCTYAADALKKLFSNNALGDIGSGNTNKFKNNPGFWIYSEMQNIEISRSLRNATPQGEDRFMRAGRMRFRVQDTFVA